MSIQIKRFISIAFVAAILMAAPHAPARAAATAGDQPQSCGQVDLATATGDEAAKSFGCFTAAFRTCDATSLVTIGREGDALVTRTFLTANGDRGCAISESVARTKNDNTTTDAYSCSGMRLEKDGLIMTGCGTEGQVALRPTAALGKI